MTPAQIKNEADAFRIWRYAKPLDWDVTTGDIAEALDLDEPRVRAFCTGRGWSRRMPKVTRRTLELQGSRRLNRTGLGEALRSLGVMPNRFEA